MYFVSTAHLYCVNFVILKKKSGTAGQKGAPINVAPVQFQISWQVATEFARKGEFGITSSHFVTFVDDAKIVSFAKSGAKP